MPNFFSLLDVRYKTFGFYGDEVLRAINFNFFSHKKYDPYQTISSNNNNNNEKFHTYLSELMWKLLIRKIAPFLLSEGACDTSKYLPLLFQLALCQLINYNFALNFYDFLFTPVIIIIIISILIFRPNSALFTLFFIFCYFYNYYILRRGSITNSLNDTLSMSLNFIFYDITCSVTYSV